MSGDRDRANEHHGQYVLINGDQVCGFYSSFDDALRDGYRQFEPGSFLVKQVSVIDEVALHHSVYTMPYFSRKVEPNGLLLTVRLGVSVAHRDILKQRQRAVPNPVTVQGIVDTGANGTYIDSSVVASLTPRRGG